MRLLATKLLSFQQSNTKFVWILIAVFSLIAFNPLLPTQGLGSYLFKILLSFVVLSGIFAASSERQIIRQLTLVGLFILILDWLRSLAQDNNVALALLVYALYSIFTATVTVAITINIVKTKRATANIICGAIAAYLLIGLTGGFVALFVETLSPGAFLSEGNILPRDGLSGVLLYYSLVSLSTIGYGDITPNVPIARSVSLVVGLLGQIYLTVVVAMLVGKFLKD